VEEPSAGPPAGTALEGLRLQFDENLYAIAPGQGMFNWGPSWRRNVKYTALDDVRRDLAFEPKGEVTPFTFRDYLTRDFRVPAQSPAIRMKCYPEGAVPGVTLGVDN